MRIWHKDLLPYLPDLQFKGQLRELVAIMYNWRDKGYTNHLLINIVMDYPKSELTGYTTLYLIEYEKRYHKSFDINQFITFSNGIAFTPPFIGWHNQEYLRVCMANLYEKHKFGIGENRIKDDEWEILLQGYKEITGVKYNV